MTRAIEVLLRLKMARFLRRDIDKELTLIEPAARRKSEGKPLELSL